MKTNTTIYAALALLSLASCTEDQDWSVDRAYDRLFGAKQSSITVTPEDTRAAIAFDKVPGATSYQVEVSTDSLYEDEVSPQSIVMTITDTPDTISGLMGDTDYYLRLRSMAEGSNASHWVYYKSGRGDAFFHTKAEQIFREVTAEDYDDATITVRWDATKEVTALTISEGDDTQTITLSDEQRRAGEYTFTDLKAVTKYEIAILNGKSVRGTLKVTTAPAMPKADVKYTLKANETVISQDLLNSLGEQAKAKAGSDNYSVTIAVPAGQTVSLCGTNESGEKTAVTLPEGMSVHFFGLSGGERPVMKFTKGFNLDGTHAEATFQNLNVVDDGAGYFLNQGAAATIGTVAVTDCEVSGFSTAFLRIKANGVQIDNIVLTNSVFHDMCSGYSFIHGDKNAKLGRVAITDCTLYNIAQTGKMFIYNKKADIGEIAIDHMTMYNSIGAGNYLVDFGDAKHGTKSFTIRNSIFAKSVDENAKKVFRGKQAPTIENVHFTSDFLKPIDGATAIDAKSEDVFKDAAKGDFTLNDKYLGINAGDRRWIAE